MISGSRREDMNNQNSIAMKTVWLLFLCFTSFAALAQTTKCEENFKAFEALVLQKEYNNAYGMMADLRKTCPKHDARLYAYGESVYKYRIEVARTPDDRQKNISELAALYTEQQQNFPDSGGKIKRIQLLYEQKMIADEEAYKEFDSAFAANSPAFTDYNALETYFLLLHARYKAGDKGITDEQFIAKYSAISGQLAFAQGQVIMQKEAIAKKQETQIITDQERLYLKDADTLLKSFDAVSDNVNTMASKLISCEKMEAHYNTDYDKHKTDLAWLNGMVSVLSSKKCYKSALLYKAAKDIHDLQPTADSSKRMALLSVKQGNAAQAVTYYEQAASLASGTSAKAEIYYDIASLLKNSDPGEAKRYALQSAGLNTKSGKPYLLIAELYNVAAIKCNLPAFEKKALAWLSLDALKKAEAAEPKFKTTVARMAASYDKKKPGKEDVKAAGKKKGDTITFGCWINETYTIPNL